MKEMKNTALIKRNVLLLAWGHSGLRLCWGWMHLATTAGLRRSAGNVGCSRAAPSVPRGHHGKGSWGSPGSEVHGVGC